MEANNISYFHMSQYSHLYYHYQKQWKNFHICRHLSEDPEKKPINTVF